MLIFTEIPHMCYEHRPRDLFHFQTGLEHKTIYTRQCSVFSLWFSKNCCSMDSYLGMNIQLGLSTVFMEEWVRSGHLWFVLALLPSLSLFCQDITFAHSTEPWVGRVGLMHRKCWVSNNIHAVSNGNFTTTSCVYFKINGSDLKSE